MSMGEFIEMCVADGMSIQDAEDAWFDEMRNAWDVEDDECAYGWCGFPLEY